MYVEMGGCVRKGGVLEKKKSTCVLRYIMIIADYLV